MNTLVYLSGPMSGLEKRNYPRFRAVADELAGLGYVVIDPSRHFTSEEVIPTEVYMNAAIHAVLMADTIYHLEGWEASEGARLEHAVAEAVGKNFLYHDGSFHVGSCGR